MELRSSPVPKEVFIKPPHGPEPQPTDAEVDQAALEVIAKLLYLLEQRDGDATRIGVYLGRQTPLIHNLFDRVVAVSPRFLADIDDINEELAGRPLTALNQSICRLPAYLAMGRADRLELLATNIIKRTS